MIYHRMWGFQVLRKAKKMISIILTPKTMRIRNFCGTVKKQVERMALQFTIHGFHVDVLEAEFNIGRESHQVLNIEGTLGNKESHQVLKPNIITLGNTTCDDIWLVLYGFAVLPFNTTATF